MPLDPSKIPSIEDNVDLSHKDTEKLSPITDEMLELFGASPKQKTNIHNNTDTQDFIAVDEFVAPLTDDKENIQNVEANVNSKPDNDQNISNEMKQKPDGRPAVKQNNLKNKSGAVKEKLNKKKKESKKLKKKRGFKFYFKLIISILIIVFISFFAYSIWNRWFRYDDSADLAGNWQISGSISTVAITSKNISFGGNVMLTYEVDSSSKIVHYKIGEMSGSSHYRFSYDRKQLAFLEDAGNNFFETLISDIVWDFDVFVYSTRGITLSPANTVFFDKNQTSANFNLQDQDQMKRILLNRIIETSNQSAVN